jgi:hypothetical protein
MATDESSSITKRHQLSPGPQREVLAVSAAATFELFRWHPIVAPAELHLIRYVSAGPEEVPDIVQILADYAEWLCDMSTHWRIRGKVAVTPFAGPEDHLPSRIVGGREHFRDHRRASCSRCVEGDIEEFGGRFAMLESLSDDSKSERLHAGDRFATVGAVTHDAREARHVG